MDTPLSLNDSGEIIPFVLDLSPEAKALWVAFHDEVEGELNAGGDMADTRDVASKAADNAARMAALFHLYRRGPIGTKIAREHKPD